MKYKQLILKKLFEVSNFLNAQDAILSTGRGVDEIRLQVEKIRSKLQEVEVLINGEQESF